MCLIITGTANKVRNTLLGTPGLLLDIAFYNPHGVGSMFTTDDGLLVVNKTLPKDLEEVKAFIQQLPESDREMALHFRMRTHGDVDLTNCHPYPVVEGHVHMMHNGVIAHVDDSSDKTKSDTWHYIDKVLKPQIEVAPAVLGVPAWQELISDDVGKTNRLVFLDKDGRLVIVNRGEGVEHNGLWFSNTYAWSPEILMPEYERRWTGWQTSRFGDHDEVGYTPWAGRHGVTTPAAGGLFDTKSRVDADEVWAAIHDADADAVYKFLDEYPMSTVAVLFKTDRFVCSVGPEELSQQDAKIVEMLENGEESKVARYCRKSAGRTRKVAEVIAWYGWWEAKEAKEAKEAPEDGGLRSDGSVWGAEAQPDFEVIEGQVVPIKSQASATDVEAKEADEADIESWRKDFQDWMGRQGIAPKPPAKWTAQTPALLKAPEPAQVAPVKSRTIMYRGYRIEVPVGLLATSDGLKAHLESEAQRLYDLDRNNPAGDVVDDGGQSVAREGPDDKGAAHVEADNETYAG